MTALILRANAACLPLPDDSVDLIVTSPPYFALRSYTDGGEHYAGQVGAEPTPGEYIDALLACTREWMRVLKPSGSLWVNLGDKYSSGSGGESGMAELGRRLGTGGGHKEDRAKVRSGRVPGTRPKSQLNLPERYRIGCTDQLGLIQRAKVIWSKPNGLPESVTDRVRCSHEDWVHLTKEPRYFSSVDAIREPYSEVSLRNYATRGLNGIVGKSSSHESAINRREDFGRDGDIDGYRGNPLGKLPGSVWEIAMQPLRVPEHLGVDHFAAFPTEWPRRLILGWSPSGICTACGFLLGSSYDYGMLGVRPADHRRSHQGRGRAEARSQEEQVLQQDVQLTEYGTKQGLDQIPAADDARVRGGLEAGSPDGAEERLHDGAPAGHGRASGPAAASFGGRTPQERDQDGQPDREPGTAGQGRARPTSEARPEAVPMPALRRAAPDVRDARSCPNCDCGVFRPPVIVDPFGGTGTTALVASVLGRTGISVDLSADYCRLATWRTTDPGERARAMRVPRPPKQTNGQLDMFDGAAS